MKGTYVLLFFLDKSRCIRVGSLGRIFFKPGRYAYVGSALNSVERRVSRHMKKRKRKRWHIDYITPYAKDFSVFVKESKEEEILAQLFSSFYPSIDKFGSSDTKNRSHLFVVDEGVFSFLKHLGYKQLDLEKICDTAEKVSGRSNRRDEKS